MCIWYNWLIKKEEDIRMKRISILLAALLMLFSLCSCSGQIASDSERTIKATAENAVEGNISGPAALKDDGNVKDSPYFKTPDYYDGNVTKTLIILKHFKTYQQTSEYSCGPACAVMVLNWFGIEDSEKQLAIDTDARYYDDPRADGSYGAPTSKLAEAFRTRGLSVKTSADTADSSGCSFPTEDDFKKYVEGKLKSGVPIMTENVEWGGHWMVIIGYDDMGTDTNLDDVLIFADPYDTSDQCRDGYYTKNFERYFYEWFDFRVMSKAEKIQQYICAEK